MRLSRFAIANPQFAIVVLALLALLGLISFLTMPRAEDPQFDFPFVSVVVSYPGTSPLDMETLVADPLEEEIKEIEKIEELTTSISNGLVSLHVEFRYGSDPDDKYDEVVQAVASVRDSLPAGVQRLEIEKSSPSNANIFQVALMSEHASYLQLEQFAEDLEKRFDRVVGVKETDVWAIPEQQVQLFADLPKMQQYGVGFSALTTAVEGSAGNLPGGHVDTGSRRLSVTTSGDYSSLAEIRDTVVVTDQDRILRLGDLAEVRQGDGLPTHIARFQGKRAVFVTAIKQRDANIFNVVEQLHRVRDEIASEMPPGVEIDTVFDQSDSVRRTVDSFFLNLMQGLLVVGLIVMLALGLRSALIVMAAVPLSLMIGVGVVDFGGFALQQMSIVGLVVVLGLLVDNAIVVVENVNRYMQLGHRARDAALRGATEVGSAVSSGTLTTVLAFLPLAVLPNNTGTFLRSMPVTVIVTLLASLLVALTLSPMMASRYLRAAGPTLTPTGSTALKRVLKRVLARPLLTVGVALLCLVSSLSLFPLIGSSLFPPSDKPIVLVEAELPAGSNLSESDAVVRRIETLLTRYPEVERVSANTGRGNPQFYYNLSNSGESPSYGQVFVQLDYERRDRVDAVVADLRGRVKDIPGALVRVKVLSNGPPINAPVAIRLVGDNLVALRDAASNVEQLMRATNGTVNVENPIGFDKVDLRVTINRDKAAMLGVPLNEIDRVVRASMIGLPIASYRDQLGEEYPIVVRLAQSDRPSIDDFRRISVAGQGGMPVPLSHLVTLDLQTDFDRFEHVDLRRAAIVTADVVTGASVAAITSEVMSGLDALRLPAGVHYEISGEQESSAESFGGIFQAVVVAVFGIFAVLVLQFRSFLQPIIIFISLPFALIGALLALYISGNSLSFMAAIGLTSLAGIVVNNAIILVDFANRLVERGVGVREAVLEAASTRARPIMITTLTTVGSLTPMTLAGSSMYAPMGWVIIGGLLVSTLLTLFLVPVLYLLFGKRQEHDEALPLLQKT